MTEGLRASRPVAPHLQIWRWTVTMAASITHRATGLALYGGAILLTVWFFAAALSEEAFRRVNGALGSPLGIVVLFGFAFALFFHTLNGLRHLYWDSGRGLDVRSARLTAFAVYAASLVFAVALFLVAGAF